MNLLDQMNRLDRSGGIGVCKQEQFAKIVFHETDCEFVEWFTNQYIGLADSNVLVGKWVMYTPTPPPPTI